MKYILYLCILIFFASKTIYCDQIYSNQIEFDIIKMLDECYDDRFKMAIKTMDCKEYSINGRMNYEKFGVSWNEFFNDKCDKKMDTLIHTDIFYLNYFGNLLDIYDYLIEQVIRGAYHCHLNNKSYDFKHGIDSIRGIKNSWDSTIKVWSVADTIDKWYIPKDIEDAIKTLDQIATSEAINQVKNYKNEEEVRNEHFGIGMTLRNGWKLGASRLYKYFEARGIRNHDAISSFILDAWYRHLNNKPLDLDQLFDKYRARQKKEDLRELKYKPNYFKK